MEREWIVYCMDCEEEIERCRSDRMARVFARRHQRDRAGHHVIVGYEVDNIVKGKEEY